MTREGRLIVARDVNTLTATGLAGLFIDELLAQAIAVGLVNLPECDALNGQARRMQRNRTGDQGNFEMPFQ